MSIGGTAEPGALVAGVASLALAGVWAAAAVAAVFAVEVATAGDGDGRSSGSAGGVLRTLDELAIGAALLLTERLLDLM
jgi:hypothetical protein